MPFACLRVVCHKPAFLRRVHQYVQRTQVNRLRSDASTRPLCLYYLLRWTSVGLPTIPRNARVLGRSFSSGEVSAVPRKTSLHKAQSHRSPTPRVKPGPSSPFPHTWWKRRLRSETDARRHRSAHRAFSARTCPKLPPHHEARASRHQTCPSSPKQRLQQLLPRQSASQTPQPALHSPA